MGKPDVVIVEWLLIELKHALPVGIYVMKNGLVVKNVMTKWLKKAVVLKN
ncbi:hypothetical protein [Bacillus gaemokensis]|nr:hypothetical protein [Bacillus gaemokensis]